MKEEYEQSERMDKPHSIGEINIERLIGRAYEPEMPDGEFAERVVADMLSAARNEAARRARRQRTLKLVGRGLMRWGPLAAAAALLVAFVATRIAREEPRPVVRRAERVTEAVVPPPARGELLGNPAMVARKLTARGRPASRAPKPVDVGAVVRTRARQRRRVVLADGSVLYVNQDTEVVVTAHRRIALRKGEVYVEVSPQAANPTGRREQFVIHTPTREVVAVGTRLAVTVSGGKTAVCVTQGKARVSGLSGLLYAGQQLRGDDDTPTALPRATHVLDWTEDLMAAAESPLVPKSRRAGGALVILDPNGQEVNLSLRKFHVDVHIEDGFARTTIDQTYFNHTQRRLEGTFYFPLPPDASLSRLAMYVEGKLNEGGMVERDRARAVYESIVHKMQDPALLEWIDGTTFKMRIFPLFARREKRIILSYTQKLPVLYGQTSYRFPAGHTMQNVGKWSFRALVRGGATTPWQCNSHKLTESTKAADLILTARAENIKPDADVVLDLMDPTGEAGRGGEAVFSSAVHEASEYLMLRYQPNLPAVERRRNRHWVFLFESSADRDPLLARAQIEVVRGILQGAEHDDTFSLVTAATRARIFATGSHGPMPVSPGRIAAALDFLDNTHLIGALDLGQGLAVAGDLCKLADNAHLVHVGAGMPVLGARDQKSLLARLPAGAKYVGVGVGKRWSRSFMKAAAAATGGYYTQINPDENISWRAFDLVSTLNTPRLLNVRVEAAPPWTGGEFLCHNDSAAHGEQVCAILRVAKGHELPRTVTVTGLVDGKEWSATAPVRNVAPKADYLPRIWARLEIDRMLAEDAQKNHGKIVKLSKAMYVMSPFTSLLVLENEAMYKRYRVDRGRKDHWALYPCPAKIPVVHEPLKVRPREKKKTLAKDEFAWQEDVLKRVFVRVRKRFLHPPVYAQARRAAPDAARAAAAVPATAPATSLGVTKGPAKPPPPGMAALKTVLPTARFIGTPKTLRSDNFPPGGPKPDKPLYVPIGVRNLAKGKTITGSDDEPNIGELEYITDGDKEALDGSFVELGPGKQHVQIDLGAVSEIFAVVVWHDHRTPQVFRDVVAQVSNDEHFIENKTVFNNDHDNSSGLGLGEDHEWIETNQGKIIPTAGVKGRYVRLYSRGGTSGDENIYTEVEVYGRPEGERPPLGEGKHATTGPDTDLLKTLAARGGIPQGTIPYLYYAWDDGRAAPATRLERRRRIAPQQTNLEINKALSNSNELLTRAKRSEDFEASADSAQAAMDILVANMERYTPKSSDTKRAKIEGQIKYVAMQHEKWAAVRGKEHLREMRRLGSERSARQQQQEQRKISTLTERAKALMSGRRFETALEEVERVLVLDPKSRWAAEKKETLSQFIILQGEKDVVGGGYTYGMRHDRPLGKSQMSPFLDDGQVSFLMNDAQAYDLWGRLTAPRITLFNGQRAYVNGRWPYVVDYVLDRSGSMPSYHGGADFMLASPGQDRVQLSGGELALTTGDITAVVPVSFNNAVTQSRIIRRELRFLPEQDWNTNTLYINGLTNWVTNSGSGGINLSGGTMLDVGGTISGDRRYVTLTLRPQIRTGGFYYSLDTPVYVPDGGTLLLGGHANRGFIGGNDITLFDGGLQLGGWTFDSSDSIQQARHVGVPVLSKIPILNRLWNNRGTARDDDTLMILVTPRILITREQEESDFPGGDGWDSSLTAGSVIRIYDVRDLVNRIPQFRGPETGGTDRGERNDDSGGGFDGDVRRFKGKGGWSAWEARRSEIPWWSELTYPRDWKEITALRSRFNVAAGLESEADRRVRERLKETIREVDFDDIELEDVIQFLRDISGVSIHMKYSALNAAGITKATTVNVHLQEVTLEKVLRVVLEDVGAAAPLGYVVDGGVISIATDDDLATKTIVRVYDVRDLILTKSRSVGRQALVDNLIDMFKVTVAPDSWQNVNEVGIAEMGDQLVITQTGENHEKIVDLLAQLRKARGLDTHRPAYYQPSAPSMRVTRALYQRPRFTGQKDYFTNLTVYAPALNATTADILAALEAEAPQDARPKRGRVDPEARKLIVTAQTAGWQKLSLGSGSEKGGLVITFDGVGRYAYSRVCSAGLSERVICDGRRLLHLYDEIGLGAVRKVSRFHRADLIDLIPWLVLPADDLAVGADVTLREQRIVAITPLGARDRKTEDGKGATYVEIHLVFAKEGRLAERRVVVMPEGKVIGRITYGKDGLVKVVSGEGKVLSEREYRLTSAEAPDLKPDLSRFVILPMPRRTLKHFELTKKLDRNKCASWSEADALAYIAATAAPGQSRYIWKNEGVIERRFIEKDDRRAGFYVLLAEQRRWPTLPKELAARPLGKYLAALGKTAKTGKRELAGDLGKGFIGRLAAFRDLWYRINDSKMHDDTPKAAKTRHVWREDVLDYAGRSEPNMFSWALLSEAQSLAGVWKDAEKAAAAFDRYASYPALRYIARYEAARALCTSGSHKLTVRGRERFKKLYSETLADGLLGVFDEGFANALSGHGWKKLIRDTAGELIEKKARFAAVVLAGQCQQVGYGELGKEVLAMALRGASGRQELALKLAAVGYYRRGHRWTDADRILSELLADERLAGWASLWRAAADVSFKRGRTASAVHRLDRALDIEYRRLPKKVNVQEVRTAFGYLMGEYEKLCLVVADLQDQPPKEVMAGIIRAADRWRVLDVDPTFACHSAARALRLLGQNELAWDYLTTPLASKPNEAAPWVALAAQLAAEGDVDLADRAYAAAFDMEPTNARILWDRAQLLSRYGKGKAAARIYRRISQSSWQPKHKSLKSRAAEALEVLEP